MCSRCKTPKITSDFSTRTVSGKSYLMSVCKPCNVLRDTRKHRDKRKYSDNLWRKRSEERRNGILREKYIVEDARRSDRKLGRISDLDVAFVKTLISGACVYCGVPPSQAIMTLDRIDNSIGHLKNNVVASCMDCNLVRGNLPYKAWLLLANAMREARNLGLLHGWTRHTRRRK
jgi:hypothetical protein